MLVMMVVAGRDGIDRQVRIAGVDQVTVDEVFCAGSSGDCLARE